MLSSMILVHSWKARGLAAVCHYEVFHLHRLRHIGQRPAVLNLAGREVRLYSAARRVQTRRRRCPLRNQVGDTVRTRMALCMLRLLLLLLLVVCGAHRFCTVALCVRVVFHDVTSSGLLTLLTLAEISRF